MLNMLIGRVYARVPIVGTCSLPCVCVCKKKKEKGSEFGEIGRSEAA